MVRVSKTSPFKTKTQTESRSNNEGDDETEETHSESEGDDETEETHSESKADEDKTKSSNSINSDEEVNTQVNKEEKSMAKRPQRNQRTKSLNEITYGPERAREIFDEMVYGPEIAKAIAEDVKPKRGAGKPSAYTRRLMYLSRSERKDKRDAVSSELEETNADQIGEGKEEETAVSQGSETESDEACKRIKRGRSSDDDLDDTDGAGGGTHKNLSSQGLGVVVGN